MNEGVEWYMSSQVEMLKREPSAKSLAKKKVSEAAVRCFQKFGPQRTSMSDIADEAGVSRKTLYRIFDDRGSLVEHILQRRMYAIGEKLKKKLANIQIFEDAVVEGSIFSIDLCRKDKLFNEIVKRDTNHRVEMFLFGPGEKVKADIAVTWSEVINAGRKSGSIRPDLSEDRIIELLVNVQTLLLIRDDYGEAEQRAFLHDFLLPALRYTPA